MGVDLYRESELALLHVCVPTYIKQSFLLWGIFLLAKIIVSVQLLLCNCNFIIR